MRCFEAAAHAAASADGETLRAPAGKKLIIKDEKMISFHRSESYIGSLPPPDSAGINAIFRGKIQISAEKVAKCYIKPLPNFISYGGRIVPNMEIISEALGYTLAKHASYNVPENAGVIELGADLLPPSVLEGLLEQAPWSRSQESYYAWFTEDLVYPSLLKKEILGAHPVLQELQAKHLFKRLSKHPDTPSIVTFDEWTENSDRNPGNLIEIKGGKLALIDHGRLFRHPTWSPSTLASGGGLPYANRLSDYVDSVDRQWSGKTRTRSARLLTYNNLAALWKNGGQAAASDLLDLFLDQEHRDTVISFLSASLEPAQYSAKVGLLA